MSNQNIPIKITDLEPGKAIICMLPDDGTDIKLMHLLREDKGINHVTSIACRGINNLQTAKTRRGKLPEPIFYRFLSVIVSEQQADDIFDFIYHTASIGQPGRGAIAQTTLIGATVYSMPEDLADEEA